MESIDFKTRLTFWTKQEIKRKNGSSSSLKNNSVHLDEIENCQFKVKNLLAEFEARSKFHNERTVSLPTSPVQRVPCVREDQDSNREVFVAANFGGVKKEHTRASPINGIKMSINRASTVKVKKSSPTVVDMGSKRSHFINGTEWDKSDDCRKVANNIQCNISSSIGPELFGVKLKAVKQNIAQSSEVDISDKNLNNTMATTVEDDSTEPSKCLEMFGVKLKAVKKVKKQNAKVGVDVRVNNNNNYTNEAKNICKEKKVIKVSSAIDRVSVKNVSEYLQVNKQDDQIFVENSSEISSEDKVSSFSKYSEIFGVKLKAAKINIKPNSKVDINDKNPDADNNYVAENKINRISENIVTRSSSATDIESTSKTSMDQDNNQNCTAASTKNNENNCVSKNNADDINDDKNITNVYITNERVEIEAAPGIMQVAKDSNNDLTRKRVVSIENNDNGSGVEKQAISTCEKSLTNASSSNFSVNVELNVASRLSYSTAQISSAKSDRLQTKSPSSSQNQLMNNENICVQQHSEEIKTIEDIRKFWKQETRIPLSPLQAVGKQSSNYYDVKKLKREVFSKYKSKNLAKYFGLETEDKKNSGVKVNTNRQSRRLPLVETTREYILTGQSEKTSSEGSEKIFIAERGDSRLGDIAKQIIPKIAYKPKKEWQECKTVKLSEDKPETQEAFSIAESLHSTKKRAVNKDEKVQRNNVENIKIFKDIRGFWQNETQKINEQVSGEHIENQKTKQSTNFLKYKSRLLARYFDLKTENKENSSLLVNTKHESLQDPLLKLACENISPWIAEQVAAKIKQINC